MELDITWKSFVLDANKDGVDYELFWQSPIEEQGRSMYAHKIGKAALRQGQELFDQLNDLVEEKMLRYRLKIEEIETAIVGIREIKEGKPRELSMPRQVVKKTGFYG